MDHSIRVTYDEEILKKGVRSFVWHRVCKGFGYLGLAAFLLLLPSLLLADEMGWFQFLLIAVLVMAGLIVALAYWANLRQKLMRFRQMQDPAVTMNLREEGFEVTSSLGTSSQLWSFITGLLKKPDFWLLFGPRAEFIVLPIVGVSPEALDYLEQKVATKK